MTLMGAVKMSFMQIIDVTFVFDRGVTAAWTVRMGVLVMRFVVAHVTCLLPITGFCLEAVRARSIVKFVLGRMKERIEHQRCNLAVRDGIALVFSVALAGDQARVAKPSHPFRNCRRMLAHCFGDIAIASFLPA